MSKKSPEIGDPRNTSELEGLLDVRLCFVEDMLAGGTMGLGVEMLQNAASAN